MTFPISTIVYLAHDNLATAKQGDSPCSSAMEKSINSTEIGRIGYVRRSPCVLADKILNHEYTRSKEITGTSR